MNFEQESGGFVKIIRQRERPGTKLGGFILFFILRGPGIPG